MATETRYVAECDRCGFDEKAEEDGGIPSTWAIVTIFYAKPQLITRQLDEYHLCTDCKQELWQWLRKN